MLDGLRIVLPFKASVVVGASSYASTAEAMENNTVGYLRDILAYTTDGLPMQAKSVHRDIDGKLIVENLTHPFESLPTSYTGIAIKLCNDGLQWPCIAMKASPAKIMQGHNVFGSVDIEQALIEFLGSLAEIYPALYADLEISLTMVTSIDITYSSRYLPIGSPKEQDLGHELINFLRPVSAGKLKASSVYYQTSVYWNKESDLGGVKAYLKHDEFMTQLKEAKSLKRLGSPTADRLLEVMQDERLQSWASYLLRLEVTVKKDWLRRHNLPFNVFELIKLQKATAKDGRCFLREIWAERTAPLFAACEGMTMKIIDDDTVEREIKRVHVRYTRTGKISYSHANTLMDFYRSVKDYGYELTKKRYAVSDSGKRLFRMRLAHLSEVGISKAYLQSFGLNTKPSNVVPVLRFINIDFSSQHPDWYEPPVSRFSSSLKVA